MHDIHTPVQHTNKTNYKTENETIGTKGGGNRSYSRRHDVIQVT